MEASTIEVSDIKELQESVRAHTCIQPYGVGSKTALAMVDGRCMRVSSPGLSRIVEYVPSEYTFTALAGTPAAEVERILLENRQYLPFDPPLAGAGATLGGTVAAGLNGPGRYRFGGLRDSLLGIQFVDSKGSLVRSGSRVVKNAAGFDLPKFMVGSLGGYGFLVELTFKVMPMPEAYATLRARYPDLISGLAVLVKLTRQPFEIYALELSVREGLVELLVRVGSATGTLVAREERVGGVLGEAQTELLTGEQESALWADMRDFHWLPEGYSLVKVPLTPKRVLPLEAELAAIRAPRVYSAGANLVWVAWPETVAGSEASYGIAALDAILVKLGLGGLVVLGESGQGRIGARAGESFARRVKQALDPEGKFVDI